MGFAWIFVVFIVVGSGIAYLSYSLKKKRQEGLAFAAKQLGMQFALDDPFDTLAEPFDLLSKGDGRGVENVMWGTWQDIECRLFDYWYYEESTDAKGGTSRTYYRFDCVLMPIAADCPRLTIDRENMLSRLADALSFHDIQFESETFNRAFKVNCEVPKFANDLIDARMMEWLQATGSGHAYEALGNRVLVAGPKIDPQAFTELLGVARGFVQHVPKVVSSLYPG